MATMVKTSKAIVYHDDFRAALEAAIKVASDKEYEAIQLRFVDEKLLVCALNKNATFVAEVHTEYFDIIAPRDEVMEVPKDEAIALLKFKIKVPKDLEDMAKAGLLISESSIRMTDETALGLGIRDIRVRRETQLGLPGNPPESVEKAKLDADADADADVGADGLNVGPKQLLLAGHVAAIMGEPCTVMAASQQDTPLSRIVLTGASYGLTVSTMAQESGQAAGAEDVLPGSEIPIVTDLGRIRVVGSQPPPGAA